MRREIREGLGGVLGKGLGVYECKFGDGEGVEMWEKEVREEG